MFRAARGKELKRNGNARGDQPAAGRAEVVLMLRVFISIRGILIVHIPMTNHVSTHKDKYLGT